MAGVAHYQLLALAEAGQQCLCVGLRGAAVERAADEKHRHVAVQRSTEAFTQVDQAEAVGDFGEREVQRVAEHAFT
ncbi:hypothetical protein D9M71_617310 [compost metagenome]